MAPYSEASVALKNVTVAQFSAELEVSFRAGIAADLRVPDDRVVVTSVTATSGGTRRLLVETSVATPAAAAGDALAVAFKVSGGAEIHTNIYTSEVHYKPNSKALTQLAGRQWRDGDVLWRHLAFTPRGPCGSAVTTNRVHIRCYQFGADPGVWCG